jgi:hypothetical protein
MLETAPPDQETSKINSEELKWTLPGSTKQKRPIYRKATLEDMLGVSDLKDSYNQGNKEQYIPNNKKQQEFGHKMRIKP